MRNRTFIRLPAIFLATLLFTACGGGGGGSTPPPGGTTPPPGGTNPPPPDNRAPTVSIVSPELGEERAEYAVVTLHAEASDQDNDTLSYSWLQTAGPHVLMEKSDEAVMQFSAPALFTDETVELEFGVSVTDGKGGIAEAKHIMTIYGANGLVFGGPQETAAFDAYFTHPQLPSARRMEPAGTTDFDDVLSDLQEITASRVVYGRDQAIVIGATNGSAPGDVPLPEAFYPSRINVSPNRQWVVYTGHDEASGSNSNKELFVVPSDNSSPPVKLSGETTFDGADVISSTVVWSPNSTHVAFAGDLENDGVVQVYAVNVATGERVSLSNTLYLASACGIDFDCNIKRIYWSPNETQVAFTGNLRHANLNELYLANADGTDQRFVSHPKAAPSGGSTALQVNISEERSAAVAWSPDGTRIAFDVISGNVAGLFLVQASDASLQQLEGLLQPVDFALAWSSVDDENLLAYATTSEVFLSRGFGTKVEITAEETSGVGGLAWSPDGQQLAALLNDDELHVWPRDADSVEDGRRLADGVDAGLAFRWSPDSTRIAFPLKATATTPDTLSVVTLADGTINDLSGAITANEPLFPGRFITTFAWSPNGREVAFLGAVEHDQLAELYVVSRNGRGRRRVSLEPVSFFGGDILDSEVKTFIWMNDSSE